MKETWNSRRAELAAQAFSGGRDSLKRNIIGFCSSRQYIVVTYNADVDQIDIEEEDNLSNSEYTITDLENVEDAGMFSTANDYAREDDDNLATKNISQQCALSALIQTKHSQQRDP